MAENDEKIISLLVSLHEKQDSQSQAVSDVRVAQAEQKALFEAHTKQDEEMKKELNCYNSNLQEYNSELKIHVAGVQELKRIGDIREKEVNSAIEELAKRTTKLEAPRKFFSQLGNYIMDISKILIALATIAYILHHFHDFDLSHLVF